MRITELEKHLIDAIRAADPPGLTSVEGARQPSAHTRVRMQFDNGASGNIMVRHVTRPDGTRTGEWEMPGDML